jgi:hypothetical protein
VIGRRLAPLAALVLLACSHAAGPPPAQPVQHATDWRVATRGDVSTLSIAEGKLSFCDEAGFHQLEAQTGRVLSSGGACPAAAAPVGSTPEVTVRTPELGPDDIVEIEGEGMSFPIQGHARDWASDAGKIVIVGTASEVLEIVTATDQRVRLSARGATRVAAGGGWAAWWDGRAVIAHRL